MYKGFEITTLLQKNDKLYFILYNKVDSSHFSDGEIRFIDKINKEIKIYYKLVKLKDHYSGNIKVLQRSK